MHVLFGYLCASLGKPLQETDVTALLFGITVDQRPGEFFVRVDERAQRDQLALAAARGSAESKTGNVEFPFNFGTPYFEGEGGDFDDFHD